MPPSSTSVALIQVSPLRYFIHVSITTPIVSALKMYYTQSFLEFPTDILNRFWIQIAASYVCVHACAAAKLESQRAAGSKTPGERAQRPRAALNYFYTTVGPKRHQVHRRTRGGIGAGGGSRRQQQAVAGGSRRQAAVGGDRRPQSHKDPTIPHRGCYENFPALETRG
jgi:hypothetical protein